MQSYALGGLTPFAARAVIIGFQYLHVHAKKTSNVIALRYCFVEESIHEICHDNVSGRNCKLSLCKMLVLLRVDFSSGRGGGGANCEGISFIWTEWGRAAKRSMFLKQVNTG